MSTSPKAWDYLILTASNEDQAAVYERQLCARQEQGLLSAVREVTVVPDPEGKRIGSGGSTILSILEVLRREMSVRGGDRSDPGAWADVLRRLRILIVHGGGDSTRLPAYGPVGKVFVPVPDGTDRALPATLFDRQLPTYLGLPSSAEGAGQVVITAGDVLVSFDPAEVRWQAGGVTGLGCPATPDQAGKHGVYCAHGDGRVRRFLQKPTPAEQRDHCAVDRCARAILDVGVIGFDATVAVTLLRAFAVRADTDGELCWTGPMGEAITARGLDFYREICCAMGSEVTATDYLAAARASGSTWNEATLKRIFDALSPVPFHVNVLSRCTFLHFGTTRQIITTGIELARQDRGVAPDDAHLVINSSMENGGRIVGGSAWIEGCRIGSTLALGGENVVVGADVDGPLELPREACLDVLGGRSRHGEQVWFIRCYGIDDHFSRTVARGATLCGRPVSAWLDSVGARSEDVWTDAPPPEQCSLWNARLFPAAADPRHYRSWLWMFAPEGASPAEREAWLSADRYSLAEIARLADHEVFHDRRIGLRAEEIRGSLHRAFHDESEFSAADLTRLLARAQDRAWWVAEVLAQARAHSTPDEGASTQPSFACSRILHTLASALTDVADDSDTRLVDLLPGLTEACAPESEAWLADWRLTFTRDTTVRDWVARLRSGAFQHLGRTIVLSGSPVRESPESVLRADEIVWGRVCARLDLGGGWTDTPPYSLERGGVVINAAVDLNGQPPIQAYARVIPEPLVRITSIDSGTRLEITEFDGLLDFRDPGSGFALPKAALALAGLSPEAAPRFKGASLRSMMEQFGGGIELTTLAAVPRGSGLGTSSIMGAVVLAVIHRLMGCTLSQQDLFHEVLRLEQALTTGGGWQDQIGGVVEGVKVITTEPGLVPDARIRFVPASVLDPRENGGQTLLYYTGITRLAKNILQQVVGRYLDRDREAMATLKELRAVVPQVAGAMARQDLPAFGALIGRVWQLNKQLDPGATNPEIDSLLGRIQPFAYGAKLLGAGGGGFLLIVCKSSHHAAKLRAALEAEPPNSRARFFDFAVSRQGLTVTVC